MELTITHHAQRRLQQRDIPPVIVDLLDQYGAVELSRADGRTSGFSRNMALEFPRSTG